MYLAQSKATYITKVAPAVSFANTAMPVSPAQQQGLIFLTTDLPHFLQGNSPSWPAAPLLPVEGLVLRAFPSKRAFVLGGAGWGGWTTRASGWALPMSSWPFMMRTVPGCAHNQSERCYEHGSSEDWGQSWHTELESCRIGLQWLASMCQLIYIWAYGLKNKKNVCSLAQDWRAKC